MSGGRHNARAVSGPWLAACGLLWTIVASGAVETTPWGPFEFPAPVRSRSEAQVMYQEARAPIVIAIRFLAAAATADSPWVNHHLACGTGGKVRPDLNAAMIRASTLQARRLAADLEQARTAAEDLRAGRTPAEPVRYAGPFNVLLEPVTVSPEGEPLSPPVVIEPHLRVFVGAPVPRCAADATGAFGRAGELPGGFLITASPALEVGWPTWSPAALGQRAVFATENFLAEGFCCGQESAFGLESLSALFDYRDYQTKSRFRSTLKTLATGRQRDAGWIGKTRDAFGVPDRFPEHPLRELRYGGGRIASNEFAILQSGPQSQTPPVAHVTLADLVLALASQVHVRAELVAPQLLESYDPERKYSFVGWPEEFREAVAAEGEEVAGTPGRVLEVFGVDRKYSFVGEPHAIEENVAFAFAAWRLETAFAEDSITRPFTDGLMQEEIAAALSAVQSEEANALRRRPQARPTAFDSTAAGFAAYRAAVAVLDRPLRLPGFASMRSGEAAPTPTAILRWAGHEAAVPAGSLEELRDKLVRLYARRYRQKFGTLPENTTALPATARSCPSHSLASRYFLAACRCLSSSTTCSSDRSRLLSSSVR